MLFYSFLDASELPPPGEIELFKFGPSFIQSLPVQIFGAFLQTAFRTVFAALTRHGFPQLSLALKISSRSTTS